MPELTPDQAVFYAQGVDAMAIGGAVGFLLCVVLGMLFVRVLR